MFKFPLGVLVFKFPLGVLVFKFPLGGLVFKSTLVFLSVFKYEFLLVSFSVSVSFSLF